MFFAPEKTLFLHKTLALHHAFRSQLYHVSASRQVTHVNVERRDTSLMEAEQSTGYAVNLITLNIVLTFHYDVVGGRIGEDGK